MLANNSSLVEGCALNGQAQDDIPVSILCQHTMSSRAHYGPEYQASNLRTRDTTDGARLKKLYISISVIFAKDRKGQPGGVLIGDNMIYNMTTRPHSTENVVRDHPGGAWLLINYLLSL